MDSSVSESPPAGRPILARRLATGAVLLGLVVSAFETTVVTSAMPTLTRELGGQHLYSWVFSAYLFASMLGMLLFGKLADHWGRRPVFSLGMGLFLLGSALCGAAPNVPALIAFRLLQGLGAGALQPTTMTITADLYSLKERAAVQAVFSGAWGCANVVGPLIGAWIVLHTSWRWVFLVNIPFGVLALVLLHAYYRDPPRPSVRIDSVGPALLGLCFALLLLSLERELGAWRAPCALVAGVLAVAFVFQQRASFAPVLPGELLRDRTVLSGTFGGLVAGGLLYSTIALVPLWLTVEAGEGPLVAGASLVPLLGGWALGATAGVRVFARGGLRASAGGGFALAFLGTSLFALGVARGWGTPVLFLGLGLLGLGLGPAASTSLLGPQTRVPWHQRGLVTSAVYSTRMIGGSLTLVLSELMPGGFSGRFAFTAALAGAVALGLGLLAPGEVIRAPGDATP